MSYLLILLSLIFRDFRYSSQQVCVGQILGYRFRLANSLIKNVCSRFSIATASKFCMTQHQSLPRKKMYKGSLLVAPAVLQVGSVSV